VASKRNKRQAVASGAMSGLMSGAGMGGSVGGPYGALIGAAGGAIAGGALGRQQALEDEEAIAAAEARDKELAERIASVNSLEGVMGAVASQTAGQRREAELAASGAAARGGLSSAASFDLGQKAASGADRNRALAVGSAVTAASNADLNEKNRLINEEANRQALLDDATVSQYGQILDGLGGIAKTTSYMASLASGETAGGNNATEEGGGSPDKWGLLGSVFGAGKEESQVTGGPTSIDNPEKVVAKAGIIEEERALQEMERSTNEGSAVSSVLRRQKSMMDSGNVSDAILSNPNASEHMAEVRDLSGNMIAEGLLTEDELNAVLDAVPEAIADPVLLKNAIADLRRGGTPKGQQSAQPPKQNTSSPYLDQRFVGEYGSNR